MFTNIMVPVDLAHVDSLDRTITIACDMAKVYSSSLHFVAVTGSGPGPAARNPEEFTEKLQALAAKWASQSGINIDAKTIVSNDVAVELDASLRHACDELGADLVIVGSHVPGFADYVVRSHGGSLASHAKVSVLVVR
ncbi:MAG: universal stress protein [Burkholderiaceae bacterium]